MTKTGFTNFAHIKEFIYSSPIRRFDVIDMYSTEGKDNSMSRNSSETMYLCYDINEVFLLPKFVFETIFFQQKTPSFEKKSKLADFYRSVSYMLWRMVSRRTARQIFNTRITRL